MKEGFPAVETLLFLVVICFLSHENEFIGPSNTFMGLHIFL
jgi:hypothetical protein